MINGHGDDVYRYNEVKINFSSNVYGHFSHIDLFSYLSSQLYKVSHYPEAAPITLEKEIALHLGLESSEVMATNGATEAIYLLAQTFAEAHSVVFTPTFSEYADACRMHRHRITMITELDQMPSDADILWLCNPNNPTGQVIPKSILLDFIYKHQQQTIIIDASYAFFTRQPLLTVQEASLFPHVIMLHSMTKEYAVPGLRIGYITAEESLLNKVKAYRIPWSVNQLAQDAGRYLLHHAQEYQINISTYMDEAQRVYRLLSTIDGLQVYPTDTHIILCKLTRGNAADLKQFLMTHYGILIRDASNFAALSEAHFRIAIQLPEENNLLIQALIQYINRTCF